MLSVHLFLLQILLSMSKLHIELGKQLNMHAVKIMQNGFYLKKLGKE